MKLAVRFAALLACCGLWLAAAQAQFSRPTTVNASLVGETSAVTPGKPFTVGILLKINPGWHIYWQAAGEIGVPPHVKWELPAGFKAGALQWPLPTSHLDGDFLNYVYEGEVMLLAEIEPPATLSGGDVVLKAKADWQVCNVGTCTQGAANLSLKLSAAQPGAAANADLFAKWRARLPRTDAPPAIVWKTAPKSFSLTVAKLAPGEKPEFFALPPEGAQQGHPTLGEPDAAGARTITYPVDPPAAEGAVWHGLLVTEKGGDRKGWYVSSDAKVPAPAAPVATTTPPVPSQPTATTPPPPTQPTTTILSALLLAFVGGLILNVMPCVLPVIALKIFGFVKQAGEDPQRVFRLGLAFVAGVFTFFLGLATVAVVLHASGRTLSWGSQFQNPYLLAGLIALIFVFGLNLLGVFEISLGGGATSTLSELSSREGYGGAFLHGLFTTLLGTSCTAPFLAISIGFAITQSAPVVYLLFATVALGMSLPYFLLTAVPSWMKHLPKPGVWMERFKQITGFIMLAVVVWLYSVMSGSRPDAATHLSWYLFALGVACWAMGAYQYRVMRWVVFPLIAVVGYFGLLSGPLAQANQVKPSNLNERIEAARKTGDPVFVDFTADWCANCKTFEKLVLNTDKVQAAFKEKKVNYVVADWTNPDPEIEQWLAKFNRAGVPMYLLYRPGETEPVVMDSLSTGGLLGELAKSK